MADIADARRRAEEALRRVIARAATIIRLSWSDGATAADRRNLERIKTAAADIAQDHKILRALLAALPAEGAAESREWGLCHAYRDGGPHAGCDLCGGFGALPTLSEADLATAPLPLPCPVCYRSPRVSECVTYGDGWLVECYHVGTRDEHAIGVRRATRNAAIRAWNWYVGGER